MRPIYGSVAVVLLAIVVVVGTVYGAQLTFRVGELERRVDLLRAVRAGMSRAEVERRLDGPGQVTGSSYHGLGRAVPIDALDVVAVGYESTGGGLMGFDDLVVLYDKEETVVGVFYPFYASPKRQYKPH